MDAVMGVLGDAEGVDDIRAAGMLDG